MYIIKGMMKLIGGVIITAIALAVLFPSNDDKCYFDDTFTDGLNTILVGNVVSESVLKYAKHPGASADGYVTKQTKMDGGNWIVEVKASLRAKNAFGVYSTTYYVIEAKLYCDSWELLNIKKK